jgi:4-hydroxybenzoate polyprenyltransferase
VVIFVYTWPALVSYLIVSHGSPPIDLLSALKIVLAVSLVGFCVYFYNDLKDFNDDLKNLEFGNPTPAARPFGRGIVSEGLLKAFTVVTGVAGLITAYSVNWAVLILQLIYLTLGILYSSDPIRLKKRFMMKQPTIAAGCMLSVLTGTMAAGSVTPPILYMLILHFIICMGLNPLMDVRDIQGDKIMGVKSIPVVWGPELTVRLYFGSLFVIGVATLVGYSRLGFNAAMPILVFMILGAWLYTSIPLLKRWDDPRFVNWLIFKKTFPLYLVLQLVPLIGVMNLPL